MPTQIRLASVGLIQDPPYVQQNEALRPHESGQFSHVDQAGWTVVRSVVGPRNHGSILSVGWSMVPNPTRSRHPPDEPNNQDTLSRCSLSLPRVPIPTLR